MRLETDISLYRSKIALTSKGSDGKIYYSYTGNDMSTILDLPVQEVGIIFYKNKLYCISVIFKKASDIEEKELYQKLADLFGSPHTEQASEKDPLSYQWGYSWETEKVFMQFAKYAENSSLNPGQLDIFMYSNKIHHQIATDNF